MDTAHARDLQNKEVLEHRVNNQHLPEPPTQPLYTAHHITVCVTVCTVLFYQACNVYGIVYPGDKFARQRSHDNLASDISV